MVCVLFVDSKGNICIIFIDNVHYPHRRAALTEANSVDAFK